MKRHSMNNLFVHGNKKIVCAVVLVSLGAFSTFVAPKCIEKIKEEKRAYDFFEYMMDEVDNYVEKEISVIDLDEQTKVYQEDVESSEAGLRETSKVVSEFKWSLFKSRHMINNFDKSVSNKEALDIMRKEGYAIWPNLQILKDEEKCLVLLKTAKQRAQAEKSALR